MKQIRLIAMIALAGLVLGATGCQMLGRWAKSSADKDVYPIVADYQEKVFPEDRALDLDIDPTTSSLTRQIFEREAAWEAQFDEPPTTRGLVISLDEALQLAIDNNWSYQTREEDLYLTALDLDSARYEFSPIFSSSVSARATRNRADSQGFVSRMGSAATDIAVTKVFASGARMTVGLANDFSLLFSEPETSAASGGLSASFSQPLLRGFGPLVNRDSLTQAERDMVYEMRDFRRYRQGFSIDRMSGYYRLLQTRDTVDNEWGAYQRLILSRERAEAMEAAERTAPYQVDQARQDEIRARNRWINARTNYINALNQFKVDLGLPTELNLEPDPAELDRLTSRGLVEVSMTLNEAEQLALGRRLDYLTALGQLEDVERRLRIAEQNLLPDLDLSANLSMSDSGRNQPLNIQSNTRSYSGQLNAEIPLDRNSERNSYRRAIINVERRRRNLEQLRNEIVVEVRQAWENLDEARQTYEIQLASLDLAERRVASVAMLLEAGRSGIIIRDQLEAEAALRDAENAVTQALVDYTITRLEFLDSIELLNIDERGVLYEKQIEQP